MPLVPSPHTPMVTEDGVELTPLLRPSSPSVRYDEVPSNRKLQKQHASVRRYLSDMPLPPKQLNLVSLVCMYTLMGMNDDDIAIAVQLPLDRVQNIKMTDAYATVYDNAVSSIVNNEVDDVRTLLVANSKTAAQRVIALLDDEFSAVQLSAAKDILDRTGQRPVDIVEHHHKLDGELRISITRADSLESLKEVPLDDTGI
jgi:hypothetical protein